MIVAPVALIMHQPDLGTAMLILMAGVVIMFLGGLLWRIVAAGAIVAVGGAIFAYTSVLHDYQRDRVNVFLGITDDPLGAGYHVPGSANPLTVFLFHCRWPARQQ